MVADEEQLAAFNAGADARLAPYRVAARAFLENCTSYDLDSPYANEGDRDQDVDALALLLQSYEQRGFEMGFDTVANNAEFAP